MTTLNTPDVDSMCAQVVATLKDMNAAEICAAVNAQLTRLDDRKIFEAITTKDAARDDLVHLAARTIVRARLSSRPPPNHPGTSR
jgi:hypothetical protein